MTILKLFVLIITIAHTIHLGSTRRNTGSHHKPARATHRPDSNAESETLIENKNVNVVVNVDPKEVATELWKIIEKEHPGLQQSAGARAYVHELEEIIKPYLTPSRRSEPSAYEVANGLDFITRRALSNQPLPIDAAEEESLTRKIVANMMTKLRKIRSKGTEPPSNEPARRMLTNDFESASKMYKNDDNIDLLIRIRKGKVVDASLV